MSKHTPGPWHRDKYGNVVDSNGERVVMRSVSVACSGSDEYIALSEANTDLATAAPDLLEALEQALNALAHCKADAGYNSMQNRAAHAATKAIAKAKGESQ